MAIRYQEPVLINRDALLATSADFLSRMLLTFTHESEAAPEDVAALASLAARWGEAASASQRLQEVLA
jgi:hypothetical protein